MPRNSSRRVPARPAPGSRRPAPKHASRSAAPVAPAPAPEVACTCGKTPHKTACALVRALTGKLHRNVRGMGAKRKDRDLYETPIPCARAIVKRLFAVGIGRVADENTKALRIIEPTAGSGNFVRAFREEFPDSIILAVDLHPENTIALHKAGATSYSIGQWQTQDVAGFEADLIGGNLPFSEAEECIQHALDIMQPGAYLFSILPVTFLATVGRSERLWTPNDAQGLIGCGQLRYYFTLAQRPSYTADGQTDMVEYGVYVWKKGWMMNAEVLPPLFWREKRQRAATIPTVETTP
jgi:hypothetical protein